MESRVLMQENDISTCLPEDIFSNIISSLPVKEAVRTSVLVKRWKNAWKYVTRLELDPACIMKPYEETARRDLQHENRFPSTIVDINRCSKLFTYIIQSIQNEVTYCHIFHFRVNIMNGELKEWVEDLVKRRSLKSLSLKCLMPRSVSENAVLVLPPAIFCALECLELNCYKLFDASPFQNCEKLRILKLSAIVLGDGSVTEIISSCKCLEELSLTSCSVSNLEIRSQSLKFLELQRSTILSINVSAESLKTLILNWITYIQSPLVINAPRVTDLQACAIKGYLPTEALLERCTGFLSFSRSLRPLYSSPMGYVSPIKNLKVLCTALDLNNARHATLLYYILQECLLLEKLDVTVEVGYSCLVHKLDYPRLLFIEEQHVSGSISNCLGVVSIHYFSAKALEMAFVKHLIKKAPKMQRIVVSCADNCNIEEVTATLSPLSLPRACVDVDVSVVIEPPERRTSPQPQHEKTRYDPFSWSWPEDEQDFYSD